MPFIGNDLATLFDKNARTLLVGALREMADHAGERTVSLTKENTPIDRSLNARMNRPGRTPGTLRESFYQLPVNKKKVAIWDGYESGVATNDPVAPHVEYPTGLYGPRGAKYPIRPKTGKMLSWINQSGERVFASKVMHPGSPGQWMVHTAVEVVDNEFDQGVGFTPILEAQLGIVERLAEGSIYASRGAF